ncbi:MAG: hypothetical protein K8Q89_05095 [Nitrosarchaeum sp.]|nr:hypothetical protein [Nitrosarchaeum sp.]
MRECKDMCSRLKRVSFGFGGKRYADGAKFCSTCGEFVKIDGYRCKCCGSQVRCKSHTRRWKKSRRIGGIGI